MKINAKIIKAAIKCQADKNDPRDYLRGFNITAEHVEATNGHIALQMQHGIKRAKKGIYKITGTIPAKCYEVEFITKKGLEHVVCYNGFGTILCKLMLEVIDGKFPDLTNKILKDILEKPIDNSVVPLINTDYLKLIGSLFDYKFVGVDFEFRGEQNGIIVTFDSHLVNNECGYPLMVIMPMRRGN